MQSMFFTLTFTKTAQILFNQLLNDMSCKIVSYMLSILIRYSFWLTNWLALERLSFVLFPVNRLSKIPQYVVVVRIITLIVVCIMHIHELLFPMKDLSGEKACVANFLLVVATYNRITVLMHQAVPFCIQIIAITTMITLAAHSRSRAMSDRETFMQIFKQQFKVKKNYISLQPLLY